MARIRPVDPDFMPASVASCFLALRRRFGGIPNFFRELAVSPAALHGYVAAREALDEGALPPALRVQIGLAVSAAEDCDYCVTALRTQAVSIPLSNAECDLALRFESAHAKRAAGLRLARAVYRQSPGALADHELEAARDAGYSDAALIELVAEVSLAQLACRINRLAQTSIDDDDGQQTVPAAFSMLRTA